MISKSLKEMIKGRWREFKREPSAMFFVVFMPILWMLILGLAFNDTKPEDYKVGIIFSDSSSHTEMQKEVIEALDEHEQLSYLKGSQSELETWLKRGDIQVVLKNDEKLGTLSYEFDPKNPLAKRAKNFTDDIIQRHFGRVDPLTTISNHVTAIGSRYIDFLIPGLLALSLFTSSLFGTGMTIVANRRENLLKRYRATPMSPYEYIVSHIVGRYLVFAVEFVVIMLAAKLIFNFNVQGSWLALLAVSMLATASFTALSIFCGAKTANTSTYNGINNLLTLPMMILSGIWFSRSHFPDWLGRIIDFLPLTACVDALRKVSLEGASLTQLSFELSVLAVYGLVCTVLAKLTFKWY